MFVWELSYHLVVIRFFYFQNYPVKRSQRTSKEQKPTASGDPRQGTYIIYYT